VHQVGNEYIVNTNSSTNLNQLVFAVQVNNRFLLWE